MRSRRPRLLAVNVEPKACFDREASKEKKLQKTLGVKDGGKRQDEASAAVL